MKTTVTVITVQALAVTGVAACELTGNGACSGPQCVQQQDDDDDGEWEIDIDGHRVKKRPVTVDPAKPVTPVKPGAPVAPRRRGK